MANRPIDRRSFLRGAGGLMVALPFLESLAPATALAQAGTPPKRFLAIVNWNGYHEPVYYPSVAADAKFAENVFYKQLSTISGPISEALGTTFDLFREKMNIYRGLDIVGAFGHSPVSALCSARREVNGDYSPIDPVGNSRSMDVVLGLSKTFYPTDPKFRALRAQEPTGESSMSFDKDALGKTVRIPYTRWPQDMWQQIFGSTGVDGTTFDAMKTKKTTIGDLVLNDYKRFMSNPRLSSSDKNLVTNFVDRLQALNQKIATFTQIQCAAPVRPNRSSQYWDLITQAERDAMLPTYVDIILAAMQCNLTRVGIISMRNNNARHGLSHEDFRNRESQLEYVRLSQEEYLPVVKYAVSKMDGIIESNGKSMLDNSVVFYGGEQSAGNAHCCVSMPAMTWGGLGGAIKTGYYMDYRLKPLKYYAGRSDIFPGFGTQNYNQLLNTLMRGLGVPASDYLSYGDGGGFGSLTKSTMQYLGREYDGMEAKRNDTLPFISNV